MTTIAVLKQYTCKHSTGCCQDYRKLWLRQAGQGLRMKLSRRACN